MSLTSLPPGSEQSMDVVSCKVFINNNELNNEVLLLQFSVSKVFNKISTAKLIFRDGSVAGRDFVLSNDNQFKPGAEIRIQLGYEGSSETIFEGIVIKHSIKVKSSGTSLLTIEAKDKAIKLVGSRKHKYFIDKKDSEAIEEIVTSAGLDCDAETTNVSNKQLVQYDATDWDFLVTRAEINSMLVFTDDGNVIVKKPDTLQAPVLTVTYGANLLAFEAEMDARRQFQRITAKSWDFPQQQLEISDPGTADFSENGNISSDDLSAVLGIAKELSHSGRMDAAQLQDWADTYALRSKISKAVGRLRIRGNAAVKPGTVITLDGVGDRFNGNVFVTGVLHSYGGDWYTDIQFGWSEDPFYKKEDVMDKPAAGLLPGVSGLQTGIVVDTDDSEDGGQYRIKVHIPVITSGNEGIWARVATLDAGDDRGTYFRPQAGDEVVLGFLNDDPQCPVVLGCFHSKDSKKSPLPETDGHEEYGIVTGEKSKLVFDDTDKKVTLSVAADDGEKTLILNDSGAITLKDSSGNKLVMDASGITLEANANLVLKGKIVQIN
jgi:Rhs element Vgr protein